MSAVGGIAASPAIDRRAVISVLKRLRLPEGQSDPFPLYDELRAMGDVVPAPWGGYFVTGYDLCDEVLRGRNWLVPDVAWQQRQPDPGRWQSPATSEMSTKLSRLNSPHHTAHRRSLGNPFDRRTLTAMGPQVESHVERLLGDLEQSLDLHGTADLATTVSERLPLATIGSWLAIPESDHPHLLDITHRQVFAQELLPSKDQLQVSAGATLQLRAYFTDLVRRRRARPGTDLVSDLIRYWDAQHPDDRATADEIVYDLTMFLTIASLETTATLLSVAVWLLLAEPGRWQWLRDNPEHIGDAVEEALRYDPPVHLNSRVAAEDTELAGVPIARDAMVHVMYGAANHDPRRNPDPHRYDILRHGSHLAFGGGAHYCMGAGLARLEARTLLTRLLERLPGLRLDAPPAYAPRMVFRRVTSLKVTV
ncbi:cytochrome P450 [Streptomyces sp. NPDC058045]|uniref:cytochrome P450 n=1 Tax=Streptomyces sp. NPDC058045 TaxID=3346311 RepID=UPI0036E2473C